MSNIVIVESKNDRIFMQAMVEKLNCDLQVASPIYIDDYKSLDGLDETKLISALKNLKAEIPKKGVKKIGIIIDIDNYSEQERLGLVNNCIKNGFGTETETLSSTNNLSIFLEIMEQKPNWLVTLQMLEVKANWKRF